MARFPDTILWGNLRGMKGAAVTHSKHPFLEGHGDDERSIGSSWWAEQAQHACTSAPNDNQRNLISAEVHLHTHFLPQGLLGPRTLTYISLPWSSLQVAISQHSEPESGPSRMWCR